MKSSLSSSLSKLSVFMLAVVSVVAHASPWSNGHLAEVSLIRLNRGSQLNFSPLSEQGFVLVALRDCTLLLEDQSVSLKAGEYKQVAGTGPLHLKTSSPGSTSIVLIRVRSASQPLTIETMMLTSHQESEDASDRNASLIIAIDPLRMSDNRDLSDEGDPWRSSIQQILNLKSGQAVWMKAGIHRLRNRGKNSVRFVTVEW